MLIDDLDALLRAGAALHVGLVAADGSPFASRAFGLEVLAPDPLSVRLLLPATTVVALERASAPGPFGMAVTVSSLRAFRSIQLKGHGRDVRVATDDEVGHAHRQMEPLFAALTGIGGHSRSPLEAVVPSTFCACTLDVAEAFDQTPGPGAGRSLDGVPG